MTAPEPTQPLTDEEPTPFTDDELSRIDKLCEGGWYPAGLNQARLWVTLTRHREVNQVLEQAAILAVQTKDEVVTEVARLRAENTALEADRDAWKSSAIEAYLLAERRGKARNIALNTDMRREIVLREINQGALAGMSSEISGQAADLVLKALNAYDTWQADTAHWAQDDDAQESDRARAVAALDQSGEGQGNG